MKSETASHPRIHECALGISGFLWFCIHCLILWTELDSLQSSGGIVERHLFVESTRRGKSVTGPRYFSFKTGTDPVARHLDTRQWVKIREQLLARMLNCVL